MYSGPVLHKILVFGTPQNQESNNPDVIMIPSSRISTITSLGTIMCDLTANFLAELSFLATARQVAPFKSPGLKELDFPLQTKPAAGLKAFKAALSRKEGRVGMHSPTGSTSSISISRKTTGSLKINLTDRSKSRQKGRMHKYLANMYLVAGHWQDALKEFIEAANTLKNVSDYLWLGSSLEGIAVCMVLLNFIDMPIAVPPIALTAIAAASGSEPSENYSAVPQLIEFLSDNTTAVLRYYRKSQTSPEEAVPQIIYSETILRLASLLTTARLGGGWNPASINAIVRDVEIESNITKDSPTITEISGWLSSVYSTELNNMGMLSQARVTCGLVTIYSKNGLERKRTFLLRELLAHLAGPFRRSLESAVGLNDSNLVDLLDSISATFGIGIVGFGWERLKVSFLKTALTLCEAIHDYQGVVKYSGLLLSTAADLLDGQDQIMILRALSRAIENSKRVGNGVLLAKYWDENILRDIQLIAMVNESALMPMKKVQNRESTDNVFLHNPFEKKHGQGKRTVLVEDERVEFLVKLQNPFAFEVQVKSVDLITDSDGLELDCISKETYIGPMTVMDLKVSVTPKGSGTLEIVGCKIQMAGCQSQDFKLKKPILGYRPSEKIKYIGQGIIKSKSGAERKDWFKDTPMEFKVIEKQPVLALESMSLDRSWMELMNGETNQFTITIKNLSSVDSNQVKLKFVDNRSQELRESLRSKNLGPQDIYNLETKLYKEKSLTWINETSEGSSIKAGCFCEFQVQVVGNSGLLQAALQFTYSTSLDSNWQRVLSVPVQFTVRPSLDVVASQVLPFPKGNPQGSPTTHSLLLLDVQNQGPLALQLQLDHSIGHTKKTISARATQRILVPVTKLTSTETASLVDREIPSLTARQFVRQTNTTPETIARARAEFWTIKHLESQIKGRWKIVSPNSESDQGFGIASPATTCSDDEKYGTFTPLSVVPTYLESIQTSRLGLQVLLELSDSFPGTIIATIELHNRSKSAVSGQLTVFPVTKPDPHARYIVNGSFHIAVASVAAGQTHNVQVSIMILDPGQYGFAAAFEDNLGTSVSEETSVKINEWD